MNTAKIAEIFESIQGEGIYLGQRQVFVRFFGCNLKCRFCDTPLEHFQEYDVEALKNEVLKYEGYHSLSLTGGEPLLQADFLKRFLDGMNGFRPKVYLETNGTLVSGLGKILEHIDIISMDFKLPSACACEPLWPLHEDFLKMASKKEVFVKMVVTQKTEEDDILSARSIIRKVKPDVPVVLQPDWSEAGPSLLEKLLSFKRDLVLYGIRDVRILPQAHKLIGIK